VISLPGNKIGVDGIPDPESTLGGLIIPDMAKKRTKQGIVKYVGPDVKEIKIGDHVVFSGYTGTTLMLEGEGAIIIMPEDFVTCKLESPDTEIPGLYFKGTDGVFFTATYEMAMAIITEHFQNTLRFAEVVKVKNTHDELTDSDYAKLK
jgi:chaperonin GroES